MNDQREHIGDYRLIDKLGEGAAGEVYLGTPTRDRPFAAAGRPVALKVYRASILAQPNQLKRIEREFRVGSEIAHPNLVRMHEACIHGGETPHLVMEFVDGTPLSAWVQQFHPIAGGLLLDLVEQLVDGLEQLHSRDIIHRDVKPANVMISSSFELKIMDFGVVHVTLSSPITDKDKFLGSIRNSSPEYLRGRDFDHRTDLYSLGTVIYDLLYGEEVFADESHFMRLGDLVENEIPHFDANTASRDQICDGLLELTRDLLDKDPAKRPATTAAIRNRLVTLRGLLRRAPAKDPLHGYVATALTNLDRDGRAHITFASSKIAEVAKQHGFYVYQPRRATDPVLHSEFDPETVYILDRKKVVSADLLIVLLNKPSLGVGQELEIAASYGKPTLLIREDGVNVSRMVLGCPANIVGDIVYTTPEDLERKLHRQFSSIREKVAQWRIGAGSLRDRIHVGPTLKERRIAAGYSTPDELAETLGISPRLVRAIESGGHENAGIQVVERICDALNTQPQELFVAKQSGTDRSSADISIRRLERLARRLGWTARDYMDLRERYAHDMAAHGSGELVSDEEWMKRHAALERERLATVRQEETLPLFGPRDD